MGFKRIIWLSIGLSLLTIPAAHAEKASQQKMADEAVKPFVPRGQLERDAKVSKMRIEMAARSNANPNHVGSASIVFSSGKSVEELAEIVALYKLEVSRIELKVPRGDKGVILSIAIGMDDLLKREGTLQERADRAIAVIRYDLVQMAMLMEEDEQAEWMDAMRTPFLIYSVEIVGKHNKLRKFLDRQDVALVAPHKGDGIVNLHNIFKEKHMAARARKSAESE